MIFGFWWLGFFIGEIMFRCKPLLEFSLFAIECEKTFVISFILKHLIGYEINLLSFFIRIDWFKGIFIIFEIENFETIIWKVQIN